MSVRYYIILNEYAGSGQAKTLWPEIEAQLQAAQINFDLAISKYPHHAVLLAEQLAKQTPDTVLPTTVALAIGGDGTLHDTVLGLSRIQRQHPIPVTYLPVGSGNDFARGIGMAHQWPAALRQIIDCTQPQNLDLGQYDELIKHEKGIFTNNLGIGLDAAIITRANQSKAKRWLNRHHLGSLSYLSAALGVFYDQQGFNLTVQVDGHRDIYGNAFLVTTTNHPYFGGGVAIAPSATLRDHHLHLVVVEKKSFFKILWLAWLVATGRHIKAKDVHYYVADRIHLVVPDLEFGQTDGEEMGSRFYDVTMTLTQYPFWIDTTI